MNLISNKLQAVCLFFFPVIVFFSCSKKGDNTQHPGNTIPDNNYAYNLISETNGWHILRKDSINDQSHLASSLVFPGDIFLANNNIYYSVNCNVEPVTSRVDIRSAKCNLDGTGHQAVSFPDLRSSNSSAIVRSFALDGSTSTYSFNRVSLFQQNYNADGSANLAPFEKMGFSLFAAKSSFDYGFAFSPAAKCFAGFFGGFTVGDVAQNSVREYVAPNDRSEMSYLLGTSVFDEEFSKSNNGGHYRIFYASKGVTTYIDNHQFDVSLHCIMDTSQTVLASNGHAYARAATVDTIHLSGTEKTLVNVELTTDAQNLYLLIIKENKTVSPAVFSADLVIYDKNTFVRKKSFTSIAVPGIKNEIDATNAKGGNNLAAVPSKNYIALITGSTITKRIIKFDTNTGTATDITPFEYSVTNKSIGSTLFSNNGRIYTMVVSSNAVQPKQPCSNIIYYE